MSTTTSNDELLKAFRTDGFVAMSQFVRGEDFTELLAHVDRFICDIVPDLPAEQVFYEDKNDRTTLKQIQQMGDHDPWFHELFTSTRFREVAELLLDGPVVPKNMQYFNKPPSVGQPTPPHQDGYYFMLDPCEAVTMWFALDDVDEETDASVTCAAPTSTVCGSTLARKHSVSVKASLITPRIRIAKPKSRFLHGAVTCWCMMP
jgi:phytanoyl-CoA hydroxylase